jgi:Tfp pilus assembly protein PilF
MAGGSRRGACEFLRERYQMSELRVETYRMPAAGMGPENPLPIFPPPGGGAAMRFSQEIPEEERRYFGYGSAGGCLPHRLQDNYDRRRRDRAFKAVVLENDLLRAVFLIEIGGRLWSLFHKPLHRELLYVNPVFQPANLAVRDAWVSGGVEWNVGIPGHTPYTVSPLFAARVDGPKGLPVLRMYEWDRIRRVPYQLDFSLPDGSSWLFVQVRLANTRDAATPMYWWSNIAVEERRDLRVIVPASRSYHSEKEKGLSLIPIPSWNGMDRSYPVNWPSAGDDFYHLEEGQRPWIAALDGEGAGLVQASTSRLRGRKMFVWGQGPGGRRWKEFLAVADRPYLEIQAGLGRTQGQCLPMPPGAEWTWLEAYGLMEADPRAVHGADWAVARAAVESRLEKALPQRALEEALERARDVARRPPREIIQRGSGWGALERRRAERAGEPPFCSGEMIFDDASLGEDQAPWLALLEEGALPSRDPDELPGAWMVQPEWRRLLESAVSAGRGDHWLSRLHLGVMACHAGEPGRAKEEWEKSLKMTPNAWACRNLAVIAKHEGRLSEAADLYLTACRAAPQRTALIIESLKTLIQAGRPREALDLRAGAPPEVREPGRVKLLGAQAALEAGELDEVERLLQSRLEVANMREGEVALTDLWFGMHERRLAAAENVPVTDELRRRVRQKFPPPAHLDFRMDAAGK